MANDGDYGKKCMSRNDNYLNNASCFMSRREYKRSKAE